MKEETARNHTGAPQQVLGANPLVTKEEIAQFQALAYHEYGVRLTEQQAYAQATALLLLFDTLLKKQLAFGY